MSGSALIFQGLESCRSLRLGEENFSLAEATNS